MTVMRRGSTTGGVLRAALLGGPIFTTGVALATLYGELPKPIEIQASALALFPMVLVMSAVIGSVIAGAATLIGSQTMALIADYCTFARSRMMWLLTGAAVMVVFCVIWVDGAGSGQIAFGLIIAGAACGWLSYGSLIWEELAWEEAD